MKTIIGTALLTLIMLSAGAQSKTNYWVVESNTTSKGSIVKIYDINNNLIKEQAVARRIDITKKKERKMLNKLTKQSSEPLWSKR